MIYFANAYAHCPRMLKHNVNTTWKAICNLIVFCLNIYGFDGTETATYTKTEDFLYKNRKIDLKKG